MGKGRDFITSLAYPIADNESDFRRSLYDQLGKNEADEVTRLLNSRADQKRQDSIDHADFYCRKNDNLPRSLAISIGFEGDLLIRTCDWIDTHPQYTGNTILDQGCDIGLLSLFMAKNFPDKEITGIDRCSEAIGLAKQLKDCLGVENIQFYTVEEWQKKTSTDGGTGNRDHGEPSEAGKYQTVFSSRTLQENLDNRRISGLAFLPFVEKVRKKEKLFLPYAKVLQSRCREDGGLISIERLTQPSARAAYINALRKAGFGSAAEIDTLDARDLDQHERLGIFRAEKRPAGGGKNGQYEEADLAELMMSDITPELPEYHGEEADVILAAERAELIDGSYLFQGRHAAGKMALYLSKTDAESLWYYQGVWTGERGIARYPLQMKRAALENLRLQLKSIQQSGYSVHPFIQKKDGRELVIRDPRRK
ncbi:MAG: class I SAM-dependent methyltransferase [Eubacterium sp.]|jgi:SAM-dependent methyltransferase|nr:class I SAM-dependent methyltransferase [Eubacterium sp.]MCH4047578.1 class I SAM-dependent methyltransferase [Eubacterium sp.]MCH4078349.1 class I SAM-dependent methyltransferase [Eubacterium sp.]MCH4109495.1 class I SAM-dependent methyltransferase [Eubacterium sp.]MCI1306590.1 class I SAM-dependent methyltransferase [Eubacterium sp.]